ncbi:TetR/AcrR family transcriptional regulator [Nocardia sp. NBC_01503]|uniref:TetR/AcrR family transcriptional regulator n=1 Tax=Nocardia sp. NBC_01503 TaxID=2975997 RepID=UPI002E7B3093|nr:TetR/AcrR family transcriptional regulator [Nocardia sp. NBC_01503]WTL32952.1 TetR/AcrR family transcriptional regulator [Nocardia sp. NBC_01503]
MSEPKMPDDLVRLWRLRAGPRLGRPAELDIDRVVDTAVRLADESGLAGATLPKIAAALSVTPMSLYRHIGSKEELVGLMVDAALGPAPDSAQRLAPGSAPGEVPGSQPDRAGGATSDTVSTSDSPQRTGATTTLGSSPESGSPTWRPALRCWALAQSEVFRRRPWLAQLPVTGPPRGPNAIAWMDAGLRTLRETGLDWAAKIGVITVVGGYVRQAFVLDRQLTESRGAAHVDEQQALRQYVRELTGVVDSDRFPEVAALLGSGLFESVPDAPESADQDFAFGLDLVLDGVAAAAERAR